MSILLSSLLDFATVEKYIGEYNFQKFSLRRRILDGSRQHLRTYPSEKLHSAFHLGNIRRSYQDTVLHKLQTVGQCKSFDVGFVLQFFLFFSVLSPMGFYLLSILSRSNIMGEELSTNFWIILHLQIFG